MTTPQVQDDARVHQIAQGHSLGLPTGSVEVTETTKAKSDLTLGVVFTVLGLASLWAWRYYDGIPQSLGVIVAIMTVLTPLGVVVIVSDLRKRRKGLEHLVWCPGGIIWFLDKAGTGKVFRFASMSVHVAQGEARPNAKPCGLATTWILTLQDGPESQAIVVDTEQKRWAANQILSRLNVTAID